VYVCVCVCVCVFHSYDTWTNSRCCHKHHYRRDVKSKYINKTGSEFPLSMKHEWGLWNEQAVTHRPQVTHTSWVLLFWMAVKLPHCLQIKVLNHYKSFLAQEKTLFRCIKKRWTLQGRQSRSSLNSSWTSHWMSLLFSYRHGEQTLIVCYVIRRQTYGHKIGKRSRLLTRSVCVCVCVNAWDFEVYRWLSLKPVAVDSLWYA